MRVLDPRAHRIDAQTDRPPAREPGSRHHRGHGARALSSAAVLDDDAARRRDLARLRRCSS